MDKASRRRVIGLMSGTSADAVDAVLVETDGEGHTTLLAKAERPWAPAERALLREAARAARRAPARPRPEPELERMIALAHAEAVRALEGWQTADLVGFHGVTLAHRPDARWTLQAGDAAHLAAQLGIDVVHDFRTADMAAGGEGAPLAPGFHRARLAAVGRAGAVGVLNLGGVANLTWIDGQGRWGALDTGPGNALLDDWMAAHGLPPIDRDGRAASAGRSHRLLVDLMLDHPWFDRPGPKSLDRDDFDLSPVRTLSLEDGAATLTSFTAAATARAIDLLPGRIEQLFVTGGGRRNPMLMTALALETGMTVQPVEALGWDGDSLEAEAFAWAAARVVEGKPTSWPETTGAARPICGGELARAPSARTSAGRPARP